MISCKNEVGKSEDIIFNRLEFIQNLKSEIDKNIWKGINNKEFDVPLIYYTDTTCYVLNPTQKFNNIFSPKLVFENNETKIFKTDSLLDNVEFHMETGILLGTTIPNYNYKSPFMNCSSLEITKKIIPDISSTELWITMIMHEYFHGFQFKHPVFIHYFEKNIANTPADSLKKIYEETPWFKESVDKENEFLLTAIATESKLEISKSIHSFFELRKLRRERTKKQLGFNIETIEKNYETMEGTARYVEFKLYELFSKLEPNIKLIECDSSYHSYEYFRNYSIENDEWLYLSEKTTYYYAIGFNTARLLDKLGIEYKSRLFNENGLTLEDILRKEIKNVW